MNSHDKKEFKQLQRGKLKAQANGKLKEEAEICNALGELHSRYGEYEDAINEHQQELRLSESLQDVIGEAVANRKIGECFSQLGQYPKALRYQRRHLELARSVTNHVEEQRALATIGRTFLFQGESMRQESSDEAADALQKARESFLKSLDVWGNLKGVVSMRELMEMKARLYLNIGLVYDYEGDGANSAKFIKQAVFIAEKHNLLEDLYRSHCSQADIYQRTGESNKAMRCFENAMKVAKRLKDKNLESDALSSSANLLIQLGDFPAAKRALRKAYKLGSQKPEDRELVIRTLKAAIRGCRLQEELDDASGIAYKERLPLYEALGDLCSKISAFGRAALYYQRQLSCALALQCTQKELVPIYVSLATTYADNGRHVKAIEMYHKELELRKGHPKEECRTWLNIADAQERSNQPFEVSNQSYKTAWECAKQAKHPKLQLLALKSMSLLQHKFHQELLHGTTMEKIHRLKEQYDLDSDAEDEISDEEDDSQGGEEAMDSESWEVEVLELSESEESEVEEEYDRSSAAQRAKKSKFAKRNEKGETLLHRACIDGNVRQVKRLLQQGHAVNTRDHCGWIPLHEACNFGHLDIVEALLDHGADLNDRGGEGCSGITPLHDAINGGNFHVAELLVARGANVRAKDDKGFTSLDTLTQWIETYAGDLDPETRQDTERMAETLQGAMNQGNQQPSQARPKNVLDNTDLFDREDSSSQPSTSHHRQQRRTRDIGAHFSSGQGTLSTRNKRRSLDVASRRDQHRSSVVRRNAERRVDHRDRFDGESDEDHFEGLSGSEEDMEISQESLPDMKSHTKTRVAPGQPLADEGEDTLGVDNTRANKTLAQQLELEQIESNHRDEILDDNSDHMEIVDENDDSVFQAELKKDENAQNAYISAMSNVGSAATRLTQQPLANEPVKSKPTNEIPALIPEENYTGGDDWLVQDVTPNPSKRKRMDLDYMFQNTSVRSNQSPGPSASQLWASQKVSSLSRKSRRSRQLKLTNMVVSRRVREDRQTPSPLTEEESIPDSDIEICLIQDVDDSVPNTRRSDGSRDYRGDPRPPSDQAPPAVGSVMRVRVRIQDKTFLIPVKEARDMSWLCEEAAKRYFTSCGLRPKLVLCTGEGAIFSPEDSVTDLLNNNEEVIGKVESWDLPPLAERYQRACENAKTEQHPKISSHLQLCQSTPSVLDLSNTALPSPHLTPLLLALQCQYSLRRLLLPGNRLSDAAVTPLVAALESLPNLTVLDLSCNGISHEGLKIIQDGLSKRIDGRGAVSLGLQGQGENTAKPLQLLEELNLSYNPLTDASAPYLAKLIAHCSLLTNFSLMSCDLTAKLFQLNRRALTEAFQGALHLRMLRISHNALGSTGVELFLRCLNPEVVLSLDLSCVIPTALGSNLTKHLAAYLAQPSCSVKDLHLSGCHLSDVDVLDINRCLSPRSTLTTLDLSANPHITEASICPLLQTLAKSTPPLELLNLSGCGFQTPLSTDFLASLSLNLARDGHTRACFKGLRMCGNRLSKQDFEMLLGVWEDAHGEAALHHMDSTRCILYVKE